MEWKVFFMNLDKNRNKVKMIDKKDPYNTTIEYCETVSVQIHIKR